MQASTYNPTNYIREAVMNKSRRLFYTILLGIYPLFFLLHWNGLFDQTYYWALEAVNGTHRFLPQVTFAFISSLALFSMLALAFEATRIVMKTRKAASKPVV